MANEVITALFNAQENITQTLQQVERGVEGFENSISELNYELALTEAKSQGTEEQFDSLANASRSLASHTQTLDRGFDEVRNAMFEIIETGEATDKAMDELTRGMTHLARGSNNTEKEVNNLMRSFAQLKASGNLTDEQLDRLRSSLISVAGSGRAASKAADGVSQSMIRLYGAATSVQRAIDDAGTSTRFMGASAASTVPSLQTMNMAMDGLDRSVEKTGRSINSLTGELTVLNAVASSTAFRFSSLSVNIGPFNLALRNIITQLPAIITGMSTTLAVVGSLITAFATLGAVTGALFAGGALAFMEEFSGQFEESAEATEALMAALKDLFIDAMAPLMNEANMELFIGAINGAARVVNRFAQFASQMRSDVLGTLNAIEGDGEAMFEALHDSFAMMEPVLIGFIEFFTQDLPVVLMRFSELTTQISGDLSNLVNSLGPLVDELMSFGATVIHVVAPALAGLLDFLAGLFAFFNALPGPIRTLAVGVAVLGFTAAIVTVKLASLATSLMAVHSAMIAQAGGANVLGTTYKFLTQQVLAYVAGGQTLRGVLAATRAELWKNIGAWAVQKRQIILSTAATNTWGIIAARTLTVVNGLTAGSMSLGTAARIMAGNVLIAAKAIGGALLSALGKAVIAVISLTTALIVNSLAMLTNFITAIISGIAGLLGFSVAADAATVSVAGLTAATYALLAPYTAVVGAIAAVVGALILLADWVFNVGILDAIVSFLDDIVSGIVNVVKSMGLIPGMGEKMQADVSGDDIQTDSNVNLNFEDKLEQNMEVNADPEEKEQMRRVVEDAMNEANSVARRQQGVGR